MNVPAGIVTTRRNVAVSPTATFGPLVPASVVLTSVFVRPKFGDSPKLFAVPVVPEASTMALRMSLPAVPPCVPIVSRPSVNPGGVALSVIV